MSLSWPNTVFLNRRIATHFWVADNCYNSKIVKYGSSNCVLGPFKKYVTLFLPILDPAPPRLPLVSFGDTGTVHSPNFIFQNHYTFLFWNRKFSFRSCLNIVQEIWKNVTWQIGEPQPTPSLMIFGKTVPYPLLRVSRIIWMSPLFCLWVTYHLTLRTTGAHAESAVDERASKNARNLQ